MSESTKEWAVIYSREKVEQVTVMVQARSQLEARDLAQDKIHDVPETHWDETEFVTEPMQIASYPTGD
jgi:hypothetical protein